MKIKILYILILWGSLFSAVSSQNNNTIISSIDSENFELFKQSIDGLDDIDLVLSNGYTILNYAIVKKQIDFVDYLLLRDVDIEKASGLYTPLMFSVFSDTVILNQLISDGAEINRTHFGKTALKLALQTGQNQAVQILRDHDATIGLLGGIDGPYIFFDDSSGVPVKILVTHANQLIIDTLQDDNKNFYVQTPLNDSFLVALKHPEMELQSVFEKPDKIFAVSDIEGNYSDFVTILVNNKIIDHHLNWTFGNGHLVLLGDFVDRGTYVTQVLWLIYKLEQDAHENGGKVHFILGNHEAMNIFGDVRYAHEKYHFLAYQLNKDIRDFYGLNSFLGLWIRNKNVIEKIGENIFVHAGISDSLLQARLSIPEINQMVHRSFIVPVTEWDNHIQLVSGQYGVLWYRGLVTGQSGYDKITEASLDSILTFYDGARMIVGHSLVDDITTEFGGKVVRIDVDHYTNPSSGIFILGDEIYKATKAGRKELIFIKP